MGMMGTMMPPRLDDRGGGPSSLVPPPRRGDAADSETRKQQHGCCYYAVPPPPRREMLETGASWCRRRSFMVLPTLLLVLLLPLHAFDSLVGVGRQLFFLFGRTEKKEKSVCYVHDGFRSGQRQTNSPYSRSHHPMHQPSITSDRTRNSEIDPAPVVKVVTSQSSVVTR